MRNTLIIGASSGIGKSLAYQLASDTRKVYGTYKQTPLEERKNLHTYPLDVKEEIDLNFIPDTLDGLVYCPGSINLMPFKRIKDSDFLNR